MMIKDKKTLKKILKGKSKSDLIDMLFAKDYDLDVCTAANVELKIELQALQNRYRGIMLRERAK